MFMMNRSTRADSQVGHGAVEAVLEMEMVASCMLIDQIAYLD